jgi:deoxyhypusine synthase
MGENGHKDKELIPVEQIDVQGSADIVKLISQFSNMGFNAKRLGYACEIYSKMLNETNCTKFFALAGAMVPAGLQKVLYDFIDLGYVDVLVTTGANLTHDIVESLGLHHFQGFLGNRQNDAKLFDKKMNRIFDVFMPNEVYESMEDWIRSIKIDQPISGKELLWQLGEKLPENSKSILKICWKKKIPIYCPAFTDSGLGIQLALSNPGLKIDFIEDLHDMINTAWDTKTAGVFIVGGGVPKNFIFQAMQFSPNAAKYVIQVTTDVYVSAGGLSSASLNEAISWGKVNKEGEICQLHLDATVALPIILSYLKEVHKK